MNGSWLAGFWDGEGTIAIYKEGAKLKPSLSVGNTHKETVLAISEFLSSQGILNTTKSREATKNRQAFYEIKVRAKDSIIKLLNLIEPSLVTKTKQASLLRDFLNNRQKYARFTDREQELYEQIRALNNPPQ